MLDPTVPSAEAPLLTPPPTPIPASLPQGASLGTFTQCRFYTLLSELWDTYFNAEYGDASEIEVREAIRNIIEFIVEVMATESGLDDVINHPGDLGLVHKALTLAVAKYPTLARLLDNLYLAPTIYSRPADHNWPNLWRQAPSTGFTTSRSALKYCVSVYYNKNQNMTNMLSSVSAGMVHIQDGSQLVVCGVVMVTYFVERVLVFRGLTNLFQISI